MKIWFTFRLLLQLEMLMEMCY